MKVDLLRQLDGWGTHLENEIEHVTAEEVEERIPIYHPGPVEQQSRPWWRLFVRYAGVGAVLIVVLGGVIRMAGSEISDEFNSVGGELGGSGRASASTFADAGTAAPTTAAATTLPPTSAAPSTSIPTSGTTIPPAGNNPANLGRAVIFIGDLAIDTRDVSEAVAQARAIVESRGGFVAGQELGGQATVMSLKIPAQFFQDTIDRLSELGTVRSARVTSEDVTDRIVDLESQITTAATSVARLQELLAGADSINTIARLESELLDRETSLERLRGQLRTLQDQVALSTIVVTLREFMPTPDLAIAVTVHTVERGSSDECFTSEGPLPDVGGTYVLCVDITNTGNLDLTQLEVGGPVDLVGLLTPTRGNAIDVLAPGERYVLWTTATASESLFDQITVRAIPVTEDGTLLVEDIVDRQRPLDVVVREPQPELDDGLPSLGDSLAAGWEVATVGVNALAVALAFVLPLLWIPAIGLLIFWWRRRSS